MTYRERFSNAVNHKKVDRVPFDFDGTPMSLVLSEKLLHDIAARLNIRDEKPMDAILQAFDIDFRRVGHMPQPKSSLARTISPTQFVDVWGIEYSLVGNDWIISPGPRFLPLTPRKLLPSGTGQSICMRKPPMWSARSIPATAFWNWAAGCAALMTSC